ncbi:MAG: Tad domain-containing protein, partial [Clostridia bacterium]|nr:Tad domain-containing protein [Clostridia bacterium]
MKEKTKKRIKGSISIFLVIIMVPMMCLSGLIVDGSRAELAKSAVSSAGDLTMNSALANYDTVLKDVYGLFAMSQTADDLEDNLYNYFVDTLMANGVITSEEEVNSNPLLQDIAGAFSGQTSNMLSMEVEEDAFTATKLKDSTLANPYILKNQIVEYQKYRAPVGSALSLLDGIASLKKILNQNGVNKAKTKVDEKSADVNENGKDLYDALKAYEDKAASFDSAYDTFKFKGEVITHKAAYEKYIIQEYVREFAEYMPYSVKMTKNTSTGDYTFYFDIAHLEYTRGKGNKQWFSYSGKTTEKLLEELIYAYDFFQTGMIQDAARYLGDTTDISTLNLDEKRTYSLYYKMYMQKVYNLMNFYNAYKSQYNPEEDDITFITEHEDDITGIYENAVKFSNVLATYKSTIDSAKELANEAMMAVHTDLTDKIEWFSDVNSLLETAIDAIGDLETSVSELDDANDILKTEIDDYNDSDDPDAFSKQMQSDHDYYKQSIEPAKVTALKTKLEELKIYFGEVEAYLKSIKFAGLAGHNTDSNCFGNLVMMSENNLTTTGVKNIDYINSHISDGLSGLTDFFKTQYSQNATPEDKTVSIKENELYKYLKQAYSVKPTDEDKEEKNKSDELKKVAGNTDEKGTASAFNDVSVSEAMQKLLPSKGNFEPPEEVKGYDGKENFSNLFDRITSAVSDLLEGIKKAATAGRDNLYVTQYVFDMFTYNTLVAEEKVKKGENGDSSKTLEELGIELKTSSGIDKNATNNYMYGAEVEYILYGGFEADNNIASAKTTIFCIRFLANSAYALTNSEIKSLTLPPALAVQAATLGVVPYKLTQVILQLCLALGESAYDLRLMEKGEKVALIKTSETWVLDTGGVIDAAKDEVKDKVKDEVTKEVKKRAENAKGVLGDLIDAGSEKIKVNVKDFANDMTVAINGQVEELVGSMFSAFEDEIIASLDTLLKKGKSTMGSVDAAAQSIIDSADAKAKEIISTSSDTVKPILQGFYNDYLSTKLVDIKAEIKTALSSVDDIEDGSTILLNVQKKIASMIEESLVNLSSYVSGQTKTIVDELKGKLTEKGDEYIDMAADKILNTTNEFLDNTFGSSSSKLPTMASKPSNNSSLASILKFNYGDYLKMFVFLNLCINDTQILSRIADVIQLNINKGLSDTDYEN